MGKRTFQTCTRSGEGDSPGSDCSWRPQSLAGSGYCHPIPFPLDSLWWCCCGCGCDCCQCLPLKPNAQPLTLLFPLSGMPSCPARTTTYVPFTSCVVCCLGRVQTILQGETALLCLMMKTSSIPTICQGFSRWPPAPCTLSRRTWRILVITMSSLPSLRPWLPSFVWTMSFSSCCPRTGPPLFCFFFEVTPQVHVLCLCCVI